jgi:hypothetical protein
MAEVIERKPNLLVSLADKLKDVPLIGGVICLIGSLLEEPAPDTHE